MAPAPSREPGPPMVEDHDQTTIVGVGLVPPAASFDEGPTTLPRILGAGPPIGMGQRAAPAEVMMVQSYERAGRLGLSSRLSGGYGGVNEVGLWGVGLILSYAATSHLTFDFRGECNMSTGLAGDHGDISLWWLAVDGLYYFNPGGTVQPYLLLGIGTVFLHRSQIDETSIDAGAQAGVGVELLIGGAVGLTLEWRGFVVAEDMELAEGGATFSLGLGWYTS